MQETIKIEEAQKVLAQQRAIFANQMAQEMAKKGINPGMSGNNSTAAQTGPGTAEEGVEGAGVGPAGAASAPMAQ